MDEEFIIRQQELVENPTSRIPICLVLDVSESMSGEPIAELQEGVSAFFAGVTEDEVARYSAEISIVTFGGTARTALDFFSIDRQSVPLLEPNGATPMGEAVLLALDLLEARKAEYRNAGVDYYQPWMVLMTDGQATESIDEAVDRVNELVNGRKLTVFPIAIGSGANTAELGRLSPGRPPLRLKGLKFREFFSWLSRSVSRVSQSTPGESVAFDSDGITAWGQV